MIAFLKSRRSLTVIGMALVAVGGLVIVGAATMSGIVVGIIAALTGFVVLLLRPPSYQSAPPASADAPNTAMIRNAHLQMQSERIEREFAYRTRITRHNTAPLPPELENGMCDVVADIPESFYSALNRGGMK